jgi:hypothetical protein
MKKLTTVLSILALATVTGLAGCKGGKKEGDQPAATKTTEQPAPAAPGAAAPAAPAGGAAAPAAPAGGAAAPAASGDTGIAECDAYLKSFDKYLTCDKVPAQAKDASKTGIDQMKASWASLKDPSVPAEAKKSAADACKQADDALKQSATALGCTL